mgnify:CR=1 FL=1
MKFIKNAAVRLRLAMVVWQMAYLTGKRQKRHHRIAGSASNADIVLLTEILFPK